MLRPAPPGLVKSSSRYRDPRSTYAISGLSEMFGFDPRREIIANFCSSSMLSSKIDKGSEMLRLLISL